MPRGGKRENAGRKSLMEIHNWPHWLDEVIVAYLNWDGGEANVITGPVIWKTKYELIDKNGPDVKSNRQKIEYQDNFRVYCKHNILLSLDEMKSAFGKVGVETFKQVFVVYSGSPGEGLSEASVGTDPDRREQFMQLIESTGLIDRIRKDASSFVASMEFERRLRSKTVEERLALRKKYGSNWMKHL